MLSKKKWLAEARLYLILDAQVNDYHQLLEILKKSVTSGVDIVQLRDKSGHAKDMLAFTKEAKKIIRGRIPFIINDRVDLALIANADGVHVGQEDLSLQDARRLLGVRKIIGCSCQRLEHINQAQKEGADYIGFGSVFKTQTKPGRIPMDLNVLRKAVLKANIPLFAIGGIGLKNLAQVTQLGVQRVALCRDICLARNTAQMTRQIKQLLV